MRSSGRPARNLASIHLKYAPSAPDRAASASRTAPAAAASDASPPSSSSSTGATGGGVCRWPRVPVPAALAGGRGGGATPPAVAGAAPPSPTGGGGSDPTTPLAEWASTRTAVHSPSARRSTQGGMPKAAARSPSGPSRRVSAAAASAAPPLPLPEWTAGAASPKRRMADAARGPTSATAILRPVATRIRATPASGSHRSRRPP